MFVPKYLLTVFTLMWFIHYSSGTFYCPSLSTSIFPMNTGWVGLNTYRINSVAAAVPLCTTDSDCDFICKSPKDPLVSCCRSNTCLCFPSNNVHCPPEETVISASYIFSCDAFPDHSLHYQAEIATTAVQTEIKVNYISDVRSIPNGGPNVLMLIAWGIVDANKYAQIFFSLDQVNVHRLSSEGVTVQRSVGVDKNPAILETEYFGLANFTNYLNMNN